MRPNVVGKADAKAASVPEGVKGLVGDTEVPGGSPWRREIVWDEAPCGFLLLAREHCWAKGETYSRQYAVHSVVHCPGWVDHGWGGGGGGSRHILANEKVDSSESSAGKLPLGPRECGTVNTGREALNPEILEFEIGAVIPRGWQWTCAS